MFVIDFSKMTIYVITLHYKAVLLTPPSRDYIYEIFPSKTKEKHCEIKQSERLEKN